MRAFFASIFFQIISSGFTQIRNNWIHNLALSIGLGLYLPPPPAPAIYIDKISSPGGVCFLIAIKMAIKIINRVDQYGRNMILLRTTTVLPSELAAAGKERFFFFSFFRVVSSRGGKLTAKYKQHIMIGVTNDRSV